jgi:hypothetical protein
MGFNRRFAKHHPGYHQTVIVRHVSGKHLFAPGGLPVVNHASREQARIGLAQGNGGLLEAPVDKTHTPGVTVRRIAGWIESHGLDVLVDPGTTVLGRWIFTHTIFGCGCHQDLLQKWILAHGLYQGNRIVITHRRPLLAKPNCRPYRKANSTNPAIADSPDTHSAMMDLGSRPQATMAIHVTNNTKGIESPMPIRITPLIVISRVLDE